VGSFIRFRFHHGDRVTGLRNLRSLRVKNEVFNNVSFSGVSHDSVTGTGKAGNDNVWTFGVSIACVFEVYFDSVIHVFIFLSQCSGELPKNGE